MIKGLLLLWAGLVFSLIVFYVSAQVWAKNQTAGFVLDGIGLLLGLLLLGVWLRRKRRRW